MAQLTFDSNNGVTIPTTSEVRDDLITRIKEAFKVSGSDVELNCEPTSPMGQLVDALAAEIEAKNAEIAFLSNQLSPQLATGVWLDQLAALYMLERKVSEATAVVCSVTGLSGTKIPFGAMVQDSSNRQFRLLATEGITIGSDGTGTGTFYCVDHGAIEVAASTVTKIVTVVAGWDTVTNPAAGIVGRDRESDAELRDRMRSSVSINARGSLASIKSALSALDGVLDVEVLENATSTSVTKFGITMTSHSIAVCIMGGDDEDIAEAIYRKKDEGCATNGTTTVKYQAPDFPEQEYSYSIIRPTAVAFKMKITCYTESMLASAQTRIKSALLADFSGQGSNARVGMAEKVYANRFWAAAIAAEPSAPLTTIELGLGSSPTYSTQVTIEGNQYPAMAEEDITFVFAGS